MKSKLSFLLFIILSFTNSLFPQDKSVTYFYDRSSRPEERIVHLSHLTAEISIDPVQKLVNGKAVFKFTPLREKTDSINFFGQYMNFLSAEIDGANAEIKTYGNNITLYPSGNLSRGYEYNLTINYESKSPRELHIIGWDDTLNIKRKQIWAHRPHGWLPFIHDRLTVDLSVTFDGKYKVFSNGIRESVKDNSDGTKTWHYSMKKPHPFFSTSLVIGDYEYKTSQTKRGVPLELWYYPDMPGNFEPTYRYTAEMFEFFEKETGVEYPYEQYRETPLVDYPYGAMETTTSTVFGDFLYGPPRAWWGRNYVNVNAHELAHQWFGNNIMHLAGKDVWLTESFATYFAKIFEREIYGEDYYQNEKNNEYVKIMDIAKKNNYPVANSNSGVERIYQKGSYVLDMMRYVMGDENFKATIKYYTEKYDLKEATTENFMNAAFEATGIDMFWFFDEWILRGGEPDYKVSYEASGNQTRFKVTQIQEVNSFSGYFKMPVEFDVHYTDGSLDYKKEWIDDKSKEVIIENPGNKKISYALFDPGWKILKNVNFEKSFEELSFQAFDAKNLLDRYEAIVTLRQYPVEKKKDVLLRCFENETFHLTKSEIISQLAKDISVAGDEVFVKAMNDKNAFVRRGVVDNIKQIPVSLKNDYEKLLNDSDFINIELALINLVRSFPENTDRYLELTKNEEGWRGKNIKIRWLELAVSSGKKEYIPELVKYSSISYEFETRKNAFESLRNINYFDEIVALNLFDGCLHWNPKLSSSGSEVLKYFYRQSQYKPITLRAMDNKYKDSQTREAILKILNGK